MTGGMDALNGYFNYLVDVSLVVFARLSELPVLLVACCLIAGVSLVFALKWTLARRQGLQPELWKPYLKTVAVVLAAGVFLHGSQKADLLLRELRELQFFVRVNAVQATSEEEAETGQQAQGGAPLNPQGDSSEGSSSGLIDRAALERGLEGVFSEWVLETERLSEAIEFAAIRSLGLQPTVSYVCVIDLNADGLVIELTDKVGEKTLTSEFGITRNCAVAINGEAGMSPARDAPLGRWQGHLVVRGQTVLAPASASRPCLSFDRENRASYVPGRAKQEQPPGPMYNVIWGRKDLLRDGVYVPGSGSRWTAPSPRTLMGINAAGDRLILMVVDGRQPGYSSGLDLETCAKVMQLFGADDAMWCDQGGSSAMYLGSLASVVNRPSDGRERPTYTHFGINL